ncbi:MAG: alpha/beta fold hydrolase [Oceanicaulis sp.]
MGYVTTTQLYTVRGETYAVTDTGGSGPAVLLMHGWPDDRSLWREVLPRVGAAGYRVVSVDWIGHGESSKPKNRKRYRIPELGRDLDALLDALKIEKCHLVAHDYGATVCWEFAALYPHRLHSYCALSVGPSIEILKDVLGGNLFRYHWLALHGLDRLSRWVYLRRNKRRFRQKFASHPDANRILERLAPGQDRTFWTIWEKANPAHDVSWRWFVSGRKHKVQVPTFGLYSDGDEWMTMGQLRRGGRHVAATWRFEVISGGHWFPLEQSEEVAIRIMQWLHRL